MKSNFETTPEREKEVAKAVNEVVAALVHSQEMAKRLVSNNEYILWLENFTIANPTFGDDTWIYYPDKLSKEDSERVDELCSFFNGIMEYADRNFMPVCHDSYDTYAFIKFNNIGYKIGIMSGQGSFAYCERVEISSDNVFIDFNDIMTNKKQENVDYISKKLDSMSGIIEELLKLGVPAKTISAKVQTTLNE